MEWNDDVIVRLRGLWDEGHSTAEIGRRLGVSKNAVVGKAHRLALPSRPSPIRKDPTGRVRPQSPRRVVGPTLPPLSTAVGSGADSAAPPVPIPLRHEPSLIAPAPVGPSPGSPALALATGRATGRVHVCCWPLGEPGTRTFRFCDAEALSGKPYCGDHAQLAYVRVRDRREEAA